MTSLLLDDDCPFGRDDSDDDDDNYNNYNNYNNNYNNNNNNNNDDDDDDDDDDDNSDDGYVPESLADYIAEAKATLENAQLSLQAQFDAPGNAGVAPGNNDFTDDEDDFMSTASSVNQNQNQQQQQQQQQITTPRNHNHNHNHNHDSIQDIQQTKEEDLLQIPTVQKHQPPPKRKGFFGSVFSSSSTAKVAPAITSITKTITLKTKTPTPTSTSTPITTPMPMPTPITTPTSNHPSASQSQEKKSFFNRFATRRSSDTLSDLVVEERGIPDHDHDDNHHQQQQQQSAYQVIDQNDDQTATTIPNNRDILKTLEERMMQNMTNSLGEQQFETPTPTPKAATTTSKTTPSQTTTTKEKTRPTIDETLKDLEAMERQLLETLEQSLMSEEEVDIGTRINERNRDRDDNDNDDDDDDDYYDTDDEDYYNHDYGRMDDGAMDDDHYDHHHDINNHGIGHDDIPILRSPPSLRHHHQLTSKNSNSQESLMLDSDSMEDQMMQSMIENTPLDTSMEQQQQQQQQNHHHLDPETEINHPTISTHEPLLIHHRDDDGNAAVSAAVTVAAATADATDISTIEEQMMFSMQASIQQETNTSFFSDDDYEDDNGIISQPIQIEKPNTTTMPLQEKIDNVVTETATAATTTATTATTTTTEIETVTVEDKDTSFDVTTTSPVIPDTKTTSDSVKTSLVPPPPPPPPQPQEQQQQQQQQPSRMGFYNLLGFGSSSTKNEEPTQQQQPIAASSTELEQKVVVNKPLQETEQVEKPVVEEHVVQNAEVKESPKPLVPEQSKTKAQATPSRSALSSSSSSSQPEHTTKIMNSQNDNKANKKPTILAKTNEGNVEQEEKKKKKKPLLQVRKMTTTTNRKSTPTRSQRSVSREKATAPNPRVTAPPPRKPALPRFTSPSRKKKVAPAPPSTPPPPTHTIASKKPPIPKFNSLQKKTTDAQTTKTMQPTRKPSLPKLPIAMHHRKNPTPPRSKATVVAADISNRKPVHKKPYPPPPPPRRPSPTKLWTTTPTRTAAVTKTAPSTSPQKQKQKQPIAPKPPTTTKNKYPIKVKPPAPPAPPPPKHHTLSPKKPPVSKCRPPVPTHKTQSTAAAQSKANGSAAIGSNKTTTKTVLSLKLHARELKNVDGLLGKTTSSFGVVNMVDQLWGKSDPFFTISTADGKVVAKSEVIMDNLNPDFPHVTVDLESLGSSNNNSMGMSILIQFYDWEENGKHQSLGKIEATVQALVEKSTGGQNGDSSFELRSEEQIYGKVFVENASVTTHKTKVDGPTKKDGAEVKPPLDPRGLSRLERLAKPRSVKPKVVVTSSKHDIGGTAEMGVKKAKERVRAMKLEEAKKVQEHRVPPRPPPPPATPEEKRAILRMKIQEREDPAKLNQKKADERRHERAERIRAKGAGRTIPVAPQLTTTAKLGSKPIPASTEKAPTSTTMRFNRPKRTIPIAPKLSTLAKYGTKQTPSLRDQPKEPAAPKPPVDGKPKVMESPSDFFMKSLRSSDPSPPPSRIAERPRLTQPKPFHFHANKIHLPADDAKGTVVNTKTTNFAKSLRDSTPTSGRRELKPTIPITPKFSHISKRELPKSTADQEAEAMEHFKKNPFKAKAMHVGVAEGASPKPIRKSPKRKLTVPKPFKFSSSVKTNKPPPPVEENGGANQFKAKRAPNFGSARGITPAPAKSKRLLAVQQQRHSSAPSRRVTTPEPFRLSQSRPPQKIVNPNEQELKKKFKAKPVLWSSRSTSANRHRLRGIPTTIAISPGLSPPRKSEEDILKQYQTYASTIAEEKTGLEVLFGGENTLDKGLTEDTVGSPAIIAKALSLVIKARDLKNVDGLLGRSSTSYSILNTVDRFWGKTDPFFHVVNSDGKVVAKSEVIMDSLNPNFAPVKVDMSALCQNRVEAPMSIDFFDWEESGNHKFMGKIETTVQQLLDVQNGGIGGTPSFELQFDGKIYGNIYIAKASIDAA